MTARVEVWESFLNISESDSFGGDGVRGHTCKEESGLHVRFEDTSVKQTWFVYESENRIVRIVQWSCFTYYREFDWLLQLCFLLVSYSHFSCSKSLLRTWSSSSQKDQLLRGIWGGVAQALQCLCKAWATPPQRNISRSVMGLWTLWRTCCKVLLFELFVARHTAWTTPNKIPPCTRLSRHWQPLQAM